MSENLAAPKVLVLTPDFPPEIGGIQTLMFRLVSEFRRFRPSVVTVAIGGAGQFDREQSFRVVRARTGSNHRVGVGALNIAALIEALRNRPTVVLSGHIVTGPAALMIGRALRRPVVQYVHAQELSRRESLARHVLSRVDVVLAPSRYSQALVEGITGTRRKVRVVHPGVDCPPTPFEPPMNQASIVVVARLAERYKGHDVLLQALPIVRDRVPEANLHVVGDGPLREELERLAAGLGVASATTFHGTVSDAQREAILHEASVFAMPSRIDESGAGEGFGIVYVEAGAQGLPVVAGNAGGALDAVIDGKTGLLVDAASPQAVANALTSLLQDPERARQMGRAGWEHARSLSWSQVAADVETVLEELTAT